MNIFTVDALLTPPTQAEWDRYSKLVAQLNLGTVYDGEFKGATFNERIKLFSYLEEKAKTKDARARLASRAGGFFRDGALTVQDSIASARASVARTEGINKTNREFWDKHKV
jgi:hypothetical protein